MTKTENWTLDRFKPDEQELARHDDAEETRRLGLDMKANGQLQQVGATDEGRMIFGHGRYLAAKMVGIKTLEVKVYPALDETQFMLTRAAENLQRKELSGHRRWLLCEGLVKLNGWDQKTLAEKLNLDPSTVTRLLSPGKCIPAVQEALRDGKIGIAHCYAISKVPPEDQPGLLALKLSGASRDAMESQGRRARNAKSLPPAIGDKAKRLKLPPVGKATVLIAAEGKDAEGKGEEISLDEALEAVRQAERHIKAAMAKGISARTAAAFFKDIAAAG